MRDVIIEADPGLLRLHLSIRGTLSVFLATIAAVVAGRLGNFSPVECASGVTLSLMAPFLMREPTRRQRQITLLALSLPAVGATLLTTVLHGHGPAGDSMFLVLVFACFLFAPRSPVGVALGLVAIVTTYVGLYLELPPSTLPIQVASQILVLPIVALACFVIVPMNPAATLRRTVSVVQARAAKVIQRAGMLSAHSDQASKSATALRRALIRLNEAALAADDQLALLPLGVSAPVRSGLVDVELWTARLLEALQTERPDARWPQRLTLHARRIGRGGRYTMHPAQFPHGTTTSALVALGSAVHALGEAARMTGPAPVVPAVPVVRGPLAWRMATRVTLAAGVAMAGGMMLSPQRWFWAVITVYVVFLNARSRGDTIFRGIQRVGGTLLGIASGLALAITVAGDPSFEVGLLLSAVFGMYYFFSISYTAGIFCVTVMLGLLYGMLGSPLETVLLLRLEETAIGAVSAIVVAAFVFPARTRDQVRSSGRAVLLRLSEVVEASRQALAGHSSPAPIEAMRPVDRQVADLKLALAPLTARHSLLRRAPIERPVSALLDCVYWARLLAAEGRVSSELPDTSSNGRAASVQADLHALASHLVTLASGDVLRGETISMTCSTQDAIGRAIHGLDHAVKLLAERIEVGAYEAFAMDV